MIGTGKFSTVYLCQEKETEKFYALKVMEKSKLSAEAQSAIRYMHLLNIAMKVIL